MPKNLTVTTAQEVVTEQQRYKLTYGNFYSQKEAVKQLTAIKKKIVHASLIIEGNCYKIFFGEYNKATGDQALATLREAGFEAELA